MISYKKLRNWNDYAFDCPEGTWIARLDQEAWGKSKNLILCFTHATTQEAYRLSVFHNLQYKPRDCSHDFKEDAVPGELFELPTTKTKKLGNPELQSARKISSGRMATNLARTR